MTPSQAKTRARTIRAAARQAGCVVLVQDADGRLHTLPGLADVVGTYTAAADLDELAADLCWLVEQEKGQPQ